MVFSNMTSKEFLKVCQSDFPEIFNDLPYGIEVSKYWYTIVYALAQKISLYCLVHDMPQPSFIQIKEKFGTLRIYIDSKDENIRKFISEAERVSMRVCEFCGKIDTSIQKRYIGFRLTTCCESCYKKELF